MLVTRSRRGLGMVLILGLVLALLAPGAAEAHPDHDDHINVDGIGVEVLAPAELAGFLDAVQWGDTGAVDDQTAELVYAGTGCTPASYAAVATEIQGNIALVDSQQSVTNPADQCPASTFFQKVQSAERAGAIGFVQIPADGAEPRGSATAVTAEIPALEVHRTDAVLAVRDAVVAGTAVEASLVNRGFELGATSFTPCEDGFAGPFECDGIDLLSFTPQEDFDGAGISDLWGWTDPETDDEYVIIGKTNGVGLFRVTDPTAPEYLGELENKALLHRRWHDVKVYDGHAFIVSESEPHGMKVFDLTRLRGETEPQVWEEDAFYPLHSAAHNIAINEDTGYAYIVGGNAGLVVPDVCMSGLHIVDVRTPADPTFAGCYLLEGGPGTGARTVGPPATDVSPAAYVHDTQCVVYDGPDERYTGRELCFNAAEDKVVIADVTDKLNPTTVGVAEYPDTGYAHQGWLTEDQAYLLVNDELDEIDVEAVTNTRTIVLDVQDLENPGVHVVHTHETESIDHNNYVHDGLVYQSNYTSGLRVLDVTAVADGVMEEVAFFDTFPAHGDPTFEGTWSNYPYFPSGTIAVSGIDEGLFLLALQGEDDTGGGDDDATTHDVALTCADCDLEVRAGESATAVLTVRNTGTTDDTYDVTIPDLPDGWSVTAAPDPIEVAAGGQDTLEVTVEVPRQERAGTTTVTVAVTSTTDPDVGDATEVAVEVTKGKPSDAGPPADRGGQARGGEPARGDAGMTAASATTKAAAGIPADVGTGALVVLLALGAIGVTTALVRRRVMT